MRHFHEQVKVDDMTFCFYAECSLCGSRRQEGHLPFFCRGKALLSLFENGEGGLRQAIYNRRMAKAVQTLALHFNRCETCGQWVCDECYVPDSGYGSCKSCAAAN